MRQNRLMAWILVLTVLVVAWSPAVTSQEGDEMDEERNHEDERDDWEDEQREVQREVDEDGFRIESRRDSDLGRDQWRADFRLADRGLVVRLLREYEPPPEAVEGFLATWQRLAP